MLQQTQTDCLGQIRLHALCYSSLGQNYSTALGPEQWSVAAFNSQKNEEKKKPFIFDFALITFPVMDADALNQAGQRFHCVSGEDF